MANEFLSGLQIGGHIASEALGYSARMQELRSQQALRQLQEQHLAAETQQITGNIHTGIAMRGDMEHAMAQHAIDTSDTIPGSGGMPPLPNTHKLEQDESLMKNVLPVVAKWRPQEVPAFMQGVAMIPYRKAAAEWMGTRAQTEQDKIASHAEANAALAEQRRAAALLSGARAGQIGSQTDAFDTGEAKEFTNSKGELIGYGLPNGKGGMHFMSPHADGEIKFGTTPAGEQYIFNNHGHFQMLRDQSQLVNLHRLNSELTDINKTIRKVETDPTRNEENKNTVILKLKQDRNRIQKQMQKTTPIPSTELPAAAAPKEFNWDPAKGLIPSP